MTQPRFYPAPIPSPQPAQQVQRRLPGVANDAVHSVYGRPLIHSEQTSLAAPVHKSLQGTGVKMPKREAWSRFLAYEVMSLAAGPIQAENRGRAQLIAEWRSAGMLAGLLGFNWR